MPFVEPEFDSIGVFVYGVYRHFLFTGDAQFLGDIWPNVKNAADWIANNIQANGFGPADFSIWEEPARGLEHNSYTQAWYVIGLYAAECLAEMRGDTAETEKYAQAAASIVTALQRPSNWFPPGSWNPLGYYNRAVNQDNTVQPMKDSSSNVLIALGVIDAASGRAASHILTITSALSHDKYGLARYTGDDYY
jgi:GH15 family glucan-1,4-alpha-glucosidase